MYFVQDIRAGSLFRLSDFEVYGPVLAGNRHLGALFFGHTLWIALAGAATYLVADRQFRRVEL